MKLLDCLATAIRALFGNKLRSVLTMLGILIGVAAVISVVSLGRVQEAETQEVFASLGANLIYVMPGASVGGGPMRGAVGSAATLTLEDAEEIERSAPSVAAVAPVVQTMGQVVAGRENAGAMVAGVTPVYQWVNNLSMAQGHFISEYDYKAKSRVVVLGSALAETLFGQLEPTGQDVRIDGRKFRVIGVLESKGSGFGTEDLAAYAPLSTVHATLVAEQVGSQGHSLQAISIQAVSKEKIQSAEYEITNILRQRHRIKEGDEDDFSVINMESISGAMGEMLGVFQIILGAIAGISLLVGGSGIMTIMLVSVTERIREIGLRKAVGAKSRDVLVQFLTEAAILSLCGGVVGLILGWVAVRVIAVIAAEAGFPFTAMIPVDVIVLALGVSIFIGIASGMYPAIRAARLDPIESLRHE